MHSLLYIATLYSFACSSTASYLPLSQKQGLLASPGVVNPSPNDQIVDPCSLAESPSVNASVQLGSWVECQINGFYPFPANEHWQEGHASSFSKDLRFTFNETRYDFDGSLRLYKTFNASLAKAFVPFKHGFINTLGVPNSNGDRGGFVYMIGWAGGYQTLAQREMYFTNAAFAVVKEEKGQRKIVEFRESSNIPNHAPLPEQTAWDCHFPKEKMELKV
ncbi:hypothetical protein HBH56_217760 [Parastagonospora nodorum]|uniref:Lipocalin-like domain-containing protein n=1 Tax=Phaeosphaeria nodorum (strain SN15 / ATCC MYA-4574 / FGSC 10173) TaxID=321614 RepID=A0A7U2I934_PHANO|nr:hypothetical protein HBH56_217760 [Parastagonospora nodorum]QRD05450.1 hypothetical protein JI435_154710 [Parastagonospora nodorum SN15]KAH3922748.1 hypothetical protein HBH54_219620 [Parastagonospora nodorum]KAH3958124.1 hypothetical protein HBH51_214260 [Parastagonospora nodorum]KAH4124728.1 hypothetical protein HBH45_235340 [Parastagonospora nodorum]